MTIKEYTNLVVQEFPELNIAKMGYIAPPELLKIVAIEIFLQESGTEELIEETRKQLRNLRREGVHGFNC